jgi:hypothetical protein
MTGLSMAIVLEVIHVINWVVGNRKSSIIGDNLGVFEKRNVIAVHYLIGRHEDVNYLTTVNA